MLKRFVMASAIAMLVLLSTAAALTASWSHGILWEDALRAIVGIISVATLLWIVFRTDDIIPPEGLSGSPQPLPPTKREIATAYFSAVNAYDGYALKALINMMIDRPHYLERINEVDKY